MHITDTHIYMYIYTAEEAMSKQALGRPEGDYVISEISSLSQKVGRPWPFKFMAYPS